MNTTFAALRGKQSSFSFYAWAAIAGGLRAAALLVCGGVLVGSATGAAAQPPDPDKASCVEQFNLAVGTPGEYQRVFHQDALGRDVSFFARLPEEDCPF